ncbi:MAG: class I SAM-dependent methyltransferase [Candidatus Rokubacteria bacterium]|nr:class I SAM-dependent methyltransferase [Candidatus Rokubacteria bacterium]
MADALDEEIGRVRQWYNLVADAFVRRYDGESGWYLARAEEDLLHAVCRLDGGAVLDLGTGGGRLLPRLKSVARHVVGVDVSEGLLARAVRAGRTPVVQMDATRLAFKPETFDAVVSLGLFEYVAELDLFLREIARVLRPGGQVAFTYHQIARYRRSIAEPPDAAYFGRTVEERSRYWSKRRHRRREVEDALTRAGFGRIQSYRLFFRIPQALHELGGRYEAGSGVRTILRSAVLLLERGLSRGLRPVTRFSTGNALVTARLVGATTARGKETIPWR